MWHVLPERGKREGFQISDKGSLVIMDIIVRLKDESLVNVELQKIGYRRSEERRVGKEC